MRNAVAPKKLLLNMETLRVIEPPALREPWEESRTPKTMPSRFCLEA
jgi:hypothetical protein